MRGSCPRSKSTTAMVPSRITRTPPAVACMAVLLQLVMKLKTLIGTAATEEAAPITQEKEQKKAIDLERHLTAVAVMVSAVAAGACGGFEGKDAGAVGRSL